MKNKKLRANPVLCAGLSAGLFNLFAGMERVTLFWIHFRPPRPVYRRRCCLEMASSAIQFFNLPAAGRSSAVRTQFCLFAIAFLIRRTICWSSFFKFVWRNPYHSSFWHTCSFLCFFSIRKGFKKFLCFAGKYGKIKWKSKAPRFARGNHCKLYHLIILL